MHLMDGLNYIFHRKSSTRYLYKSIRDADNTRITRTSGNYRYHEIKFIIVPVNKMIIKYEQVDITKVLF